MPLSTASIPDAFLLLLLLASTAAAAAASVPVGDSHVNTTVVFASGAATSPRDDTEMYICYLCTGRNPLLIRYCPIYWDECHLVCYADADASASAIPAVAAPPSTGPPADERDEECYVMKLYRNGSYTIVSHLGCSQIARCLLSCGGGDMADRNALGTATAGPATTAAIQASFPLPRVADFQRCGTQVNAP